MRRMIRRHSGRVTLAGVEVRCAVSDNAAADVLLADGGGDGTTGNIALTIMKEDVAGLDFNTDSDCLYKGQQLEIKTIGGLNDPDNPALTVVIGDEENASDD